MEPIAIIGMGCRFPSADNPEEYWHLLSNGIDGIKEVPSNRWDTKSLYSEKPVTPGKMNTKWGGFLEQVDGFDAEFFGISPREAEYIDPQQRLLLEVAWEALETAGIVPRELAASQTGVFVGISTNDYGRSTLQDITNLSAYSGTGNAFCIAANRLSYFLNLKGPSLAIDTACSSSLVAVHYACQSLRLHESELCLAGGVNLILSPEFSIIFSQARMMASDGRCKTFDAKADGYVRGEGCGIVVLKRLSDALRDGDNIQAVIQGSAINQDGLTNGITAPNGPSQQAVIRQALKNAEVKANQISYVEAHGTGTPLGDPQEFNSLKRVFSEERQNDQPCWIGSVKTNIGHLESAAGVAGLIKVVLSLQNKEIPPHLHLQELNPYISLEGTPFTIPTRCQNWKPGTNKLLAGVSSFGFGGTNSHVIVEEAPPNLQPEKNQDLYVDRPYHLLTLSAKTKPALLEMATRYQEYLTSNPDVSVGDVCFSANTGRSQFDPRLAVIADSKEQLQRHLRNFTEGKEDVGYVQGRLNQRQIPKIAFLFTGQGSQYVAMGRQLYETQPIFRSVLDQCNEILRPHLSKPLLEVIYGEDADVSLINQTAYTQPALFAIEYALFKLWQSWGINPDVVMGHSIGEYTAACVAGVFSLEDGLKLIAHRGRLMQQMPSGGKMVALMASAEQIREIIKPYDSKVSLAAINGPQSVVISGEGEAITEICQQLESKGIKTKQLQVSHAFHSPLMEPMLAEFAQVAQEITYNSPQISIISNVTGQQADESIATSEYWVRHVREAVKFAQSMETLHEQGCKIFLEIGPKPILLGMGRQCLPEEGEIWLPSLRPNQPDWQQILTSLGELYVKGAKIDWLEFEKDYNHQKVVLPTYPFQRQRYWLETEPKQSQAEVMKQLELDNLEQLQKNLEQTGKLSQDEVELLPKLLELLAQQQQEQVENAEIEHWFYEIQWKQKPRKIKPTLKDLEGGKWVFFADREGLGEKIAEKLKTLGYQCDLVFVGENNTHEKEKWYINPSQKEHFQKLWEALGFSTDLPLKGIINLWGLETTATKDLNLNSLKEAQKLTCGTLLYTLQTLTELSLQVAPKLWLVTRGVQWIESEKTSLSVAQSPLWGMGKVVGLEFPDWWGGMIDLDINTSDQEINQLLSEIENSQGEDKMAFRGGKRYVARLVKSSIGENKPLTIHSDKTYLITGGLGALGLKVAQWMVEKGVRYLALVGRRKPSSDAQSILSQMTKQGVKVEIISADVSEEEAMREVLKTIESKMPPLKGIIYAAGTLDDGVLLEQNWQRFEKVMSPKIEGTWNLHELTQNYSLDFCVFFSSVASLLGSPGQSNYAAANQFMDSLAHYRHLQGKPALSINWGPWAEGGMASELQQSQQEKLQKQGINFIPVRQGLKALERLINSNRGKLGVLSIDWHIFAKYSQKRALPILLDILSSFDGFSYNKENKSFLEKDWLTQIESASPEDRLDVVTNYLRQKISQALKLAPEQIILNSSLNMMGMDSLMAMELRNRVKTDLKIDISVSQVMAGQNIVEIASYLEEKLFSSTVQGNQEETPNLTMETATEEEILENIAELSDEDVDSLLSKVIEMLAKEEKDIDE